MKNGKPKVAIVHDWLVAYAGADRVVDCMHHVFLMHPSIPSSMTKTTCLRGSRIMISAPPISKSCLCHQAVSCHAAVDAPRV